MSITLAQAIPLKAKILGRVNELLRERNEAATIEHHKDARDVEIAELVPTRTVEDITSEIKKANADYRDLLILIATANLENTVEWDGQDLPILNAIELADFLRKEANIQKQLGGRKKVIRGTGNHWNPSPDVITRATYEPETYRVNGLKLDRQATLLSSLIDAINQTVTLDFDASDYMG